MKKIFNKSVLIPFAIMATVIMLPVTFAVADETLSTDGGDTTGTVTNTSTVSAPPTDGDGAVGVVTNTTTVSAPATDGGDTSGVVTNVPTISAPTTDGDDTTGVVTNVPTVPAPTTDGDDTTGVITRPEGGSNNGGGTEPVSTTTATSTVGGTSPSPGSDGSSDNGVTYHKIAYSISGPGTITCRIDNKEGPCPERLAEAVPVSFKIKPGLGSMITGLTRDGMEMNGCVGMRSTCSLLTWLFGDTNIEAKFSPVPESLESIEVVSSTTTSTSSTAVTSTGSSSMESNTTKPQVVSTGSGATTGHSSHYTGSTRKLYSDLERPVVVAQGQDSSSRSVPSLEAYRPSSEPIVVKTGMNKKLFGHMNESRWQSIVNSLKPIKVTMSPVSLFH